MGLRHLLPDLCTTHSSSAALGQPLQSPQTPRRHRHDSTDGSAPRGEFMNNLPSRLLKNSPETLRGPLPTLGKETAEVAPRSACRRRPKPQVPATPVEPKSSEDAAPSSASAFLADARALRVSLSPESSSVRPREEFFSSLLELTTSQGPGSWHRCATAIPQRPAEGSASDSRTKTTCGAKDNCSQPEHSRQLLACQVGASRFRA